MISYLEKKRFWATQMVVRFLDPLVRVGEPDYTDSILVLVIKVHIAGRPGNKGGRAHKIFSLLCAHTLSQKLANMRV